MLLATLLLCVVLNGCAALTNPGADGVPVRLVPPELLAQPKDHDVTIPLNLLGQPPAPTYRLAPGDVLGVYIEGVLGERNQPIPVHTAPLVRIRDQQPLPPSAGYPVEVDEHGKIALPLVGELYVRCMSVAEAREAIRALYVKKEILKPDNERILVSLLYRHQFQVIVLRQEAANLNLGPEGLVSSSKRGTGQLVDLPAGENDVLHALAFTGGLPGVDTYNSIIIFRDCFHTSQEGAAVLQQLQAHPRDAHTLPEVCRGSKTITIPLRLPPGMKLPIGPQDILLHTGDVVFLEARETDRFFTGGLLPPAAHILPRDYDLDVLEAVSQVRGPLFNGAFGGSNLSGNLVAPGVGNPSPSLLTVLRRTPKGGQVPINVDLRAAVHDPQERILVKAGDVLILQEAPGEALGRWFYQSFFNFNIAWQLFHSKFATGIVDVSAPDRLPGRIEQVTIPQQ